MAEDCTSSLRIETRRLADIEELRSSAALELENMFSCLRAAVKGHRSSFMLLCSQEYLRSISLKYKLAATLAGPEFASLVKSLDDRRIHGEQVRDPGGGESKAETDQCAVVES